MSDVGLDADLTLDIRTALQQVARLERALDAATHLRLTADARSVTGSITGAVDAADTAVIVTGDAAELTGDVTAAIDNADTAVTVTGDAAELTGDVTAAIDNADTAVTVTGDASELTGDVTAAVDAGDSHVEITADAGGLVDARDAADSLGLSLGTARLNATSLGTVLRGGIFIAIAKQAYDAAQAASDLAESQSKATQVFQDSVGVVTAFGRTSATSVGLSTQAATEATGTFGNLFTALGLARDAAADMSPDVVTLGADLASFNNLGVEDTLEKLRSGLVGEIEPLRSLGISFNAAQVEAKAMSLGLADVSGELSEGAKVQARWALIQEQSTNAAGDFARTSDGLANQQRILTAEFQNATVAVGQQLLPVLLELVGAAREAGPELTDLAVAGARLLATSFQALVPLLGTTTSLLTALEPAVSGLATVIDAIPDPLLETVAALIVANRIAGLAGTSIGLLGSRFAGLATTIGRAGPVIGGLLAMDVLFDSVFGDVAPNAADIDKLTGSLERYGQVQRLTGEGLEILGADFDKLKFGIQALNDPSILQQGEGAVDSFVSTLTFGLADTVTDVEQAKQTVQDFDTTLAGIAATDPGQAFDIVRAAAAEMGVPVDELLSQLPQYSEAIDAAKEAAAAAGESVNEFGVAMEDQAAAVDAAREAIQAYSDTQHAIIDPIFAALDASRQVEAAKRTEAEAQTALNAAIKEHGPNSAEAAAATRALQDAQLAQGQAALNVEDAMTFLRSELEAGRVTTEGARQKIQQWAADGLITADAAATLSRALGTTTGAAQTLGAQRPVVYVSAAGIPAANENLRRVKAAAEAIPDLETITIVADGSSATATANGVVRYIKGLTGTITITSYVVPPQQTFGGRRQGGGGVRADEWYVIGEKGPEIFFPGIAGTIVPNNQIAEVRHTGLAGLGGGNVVNLNGDVNILLPSGVDERSARRIGSAAADGFWGTLQDRRVAATARFS